LSIIAFLFAVAATPNEAGIRAAAAQDIRVAAVGYRLARGGIGPARDGLCDGRVSLPGMLVQDITQFSDADRDAARRVLGIGNGPTIIAVIPDSAAAWAGLKAGDEVLAVNAQAVNASVHSAPYARMAQFERFIDKGLTLGGATLTVRRAGGNAGAYLTPQGGCASWFQVVSRRSINARADGRYVQIDGAMVDFVTNDDELATIMGHELAHNVLRHIALKTPSKQAEYEADRLGVWLMARAGYDVDAVVPFWTRFEKRTNAGIFADGTHPSPKKRLAAVAAAVAELKAQRAAGKPLLPSPVPRAQ
jgi:beta-barrel assembly-enhancing protease